MDKYIEYFSCRDDFYNAILDILSGESTSHNTETCVCCGAKIQEGLQVCIACEKDG